MSTEIPRNPPGAPSVPQVPLPQTCFGVLEHTGLPYSDNENITDIPPDFGWMTEINSYMGSFQYSVMDEIGVTKHEFSVQAPNYEANTKPWVKKDAHPMIWQNIPFMSSKWWTGVPSFKFLAIKPPRVAGKLLIRFSFVNRLAGDDSPLDGDKLYRSILKEWDLGASNEFEFDVPALNILQTRPTWIPSTPKPFNISGLSQNSGFFCLQQPNPFTWMMGRIYVEPCQSLQPGSIFPDTIRILIFRSFKNTEFYTPQDPRVEAEHVLFNPLMAPPTFIGQGFQP